MTDSPKKILPLGESALIVEFGDEMSAELNSKAVALADHLSAEPFPGFIEAIPAYASTTVIYDPVTVRQQYPSASAFSAVRSIVAGLAEQSAGGSAARKEIVEIPSKFDAVSGLDLESIALARDMSVSDVIETFISRTYRVYMIGFLPGFAYMGEVDESIRMPRRNQPRTSVPKGSIGLAGSQTGIYPLSSPGGWQIIGHTDLELFSPYTDPPSLLRPGDRVRFTPL